MLLPEVPSWFWDEARGMTPLARQEVGLVLPEEQATPKRLTRIDEDETSDDDEGEALLPLPTLVKNDPGASTGHPDVVTGWECPDCGQSVAKSVKGVHIARHRRAQKRAGR
jgi:hypothetical protein